MQAFNVVDDAPRIPWWAWIAIHIFTIPVLFLSSGGLQLIRHPEFRLVALIMAVLMPALMESQSWRFTKGLDAAGRRVLAETAQRYAFGMYLVMLMITLAIRG